MLRSSLLLKNLSALVLSFGNLAFCQSPSTPNVKQDVKNSSCSNIVALAGSVEVNCSSLTPAQQKLIASIPGMLHKIIADQLDPQVVMQKLDEIIANQKREAEEIGQIRGRQGPWLLDDVTKRQMFDILKNGPKVPIVVDELAESTKNFAEGIIEVFGALKWPTMRQIDTLSGPIPVGISCRGMEKMSDSMAKIEPALQLISSDIHCVTVSAGRLEIHDRDSVVIEVGERP